MSTLVLLLQQSYAVRHAPLVPPFRHWRMRPPACAHSHSSAVAASPAAAWQQQPAAPRTSPRCSCRPVGVRSGSPACSCQGSWGGPCWVWCATIRAAMRSSEGMPCDWTVMQAMSDVFRQLEARCGEHAVQCVHVWFNPRALHLRLPLYMHGLT